MIEFYYENFKKNYKKKVEDLTKDIEILLAYEGIKIQKANNNIVDSIYKSNLSNEAWNKVNDLYFTLELEKANISTTLDKFRQKDNRKINKKNRKLFIDTFAGCGGLSQGLIQAGLEPILVNEIEPRFLETYYFNHKLDIKSYFCGDIKMLVDGPILDDPKYYETDLVVGGPPCQGFSMANRQRILDDPRNELYKQFLKLLGRVRPKFFIMENVKGMMKKSGEIIENFESILGEEYSIRMLLLNAKNYGVPQNRERVFVIGTRLQYVDIDIVIDEIKTHKYTNRQYFLKDALLGLPEIHPKREKNKIKDENDKTGIKFRLVKQDNKNDFTEFLGGHIDYISNHVNRYNNERDIEIFSRLPQGANSLHPSIEDIMPYRSRNHMFKDKYYKLKEDDVCKTITSHMKFDCNMYIHPKQARGLSPREAARVQTFPDDYIFMGAQNLWYAQIGNAVPVKLAQAIGEIITKYIK